MAPLRLTPWLAAALVTAALLVGPTAVAAAQDAEIGRLIEEGRARYRELGFMEPELTMWARVDALAAALRARPERVLALFGHSDYFNVLLERHCGVEDCWLANAEVMAVPLRPAES